LSLLILKGGFELFRQQISSTGRLSGIEHMIAFFPFSVCLALVLIGIGLGFAGSFVSLRRFGDSRT
jgi:cell division transport system permease protein